MKRLRLIFLAAFLPVLAALSGCRVDEGVEVATGAPVQVGSYSAVFAGTLDVSGFDGAFSRGVCWGLSPNPTLDDSRVTAPAGGSGAFFCKISGLAPSTTYHARAVAFRGRQAVYGEDVAFTTSPPYKLSVLGDSYSTFDGWNTPPDSHSWYHPEPDNHNDVVRVEQMWWHILMTTMQMRLEVNNAYSGSTICNFTDEFAEFSFLARMDNLGDPDVIVVLATKNDWYYYEFHEQHLLTLGEYQYGGWSDEDLMAFRPALAKMFDFLLSRYPLSRLCFVLPTDIGEEIPRSALTVAAHYGVPCVVLHDIEKTEWHPTARGMEAIASQVAEALGSLE